MKIIVKAKPNSKREYIEKIDGVGSVDEIHLAVAVKEPPIEGRANAAIIRELAIYLKIPSGKIKLVSGYSSKLKIFNVID